MMEIEYKFAGFFDYLRDKCINYDINLGMDKGYLPGVRPPRFAPPEFVLYVPATGIKWQVFDDWGLRKEAIDVGQCIRKFIEMRQKNPKLWSY